MSFQIINAAIDSEQNDDLHEARLLLLLRHAAERRDGNIDGITKLAKLDFFVRYPEYLQHLLDEETERKRRIEVPMQDYERATVESKMIRYKYGPWDPRYRRWIGLLLSRGLATTFLRGRTVYVQLSERGKNVADELTEKDIFSDLDERSEIVIRTLGSKSGTWLKNRVYELLPELSQMELGETIQ